MSTLKEFEAVLAKYKEALAGPDWTKSLLLYKDLVDMLEQLSEEDLAAVKQLSYGFLLS